MATYTHVKNLPWNIRHVCDDGAGNIYIFASFNIYLKVFWYNIDTDTLTDISGDMFTGFRLGSDGSGVIAYFKGTVYVGLAAPAGTDEVRVYRWDGKQNWTMVDAVPLVYGSLFQQLDADSDIIAHSFLSSGVPATRHFRCSLDGATWSAHSNSYGTQNVEEIVYSDYLGKVVVYSYSGPNRHCDVYSSGAWVALNVSGALPHFYGTGDNMQYFTYEHTAPAKPVAYSYDWGDTSSDTPSSFYFQANPGIRMCGHDTWMLAAFEDRVFVWDAVANDFVEDGQIGTGTDIIPRVAEHRGRLYVVVDNSGIWRRDEPIASTTVKAYAASSTRPMDVSADDRYLYIALLYKGTPVLLKMQADLSVDPTVVYSSAGSAINVKCGDMHNDWVWIAGDFATSSVRASIDGGAMWTQKDPGTWVGVAQPPVIGPNDDNAVLVPTSVDDDLHETLDGGLAWAINNAALPFDVMSMDRLDVNPREIVIGSSSGGDIYYSPNDGITFYDIGDPAMGAFPITDVIVG